MVIQRPLGDLLAMQTKFLVILMVLGIVSNEGDVINPHFFP